MTAKKRTIKIRINLEYGVEYRGRKNEAQKVVFFIWP